MPTRTLLLLAACACIRWVPASAAESSAVLLGAGLTIDASCARHVEIMPDGGLHGMAAIHATADHQEEIDRLLMTSHDTVGLRTRGDQCWRDAFGAGRTLVISVRVPAGFPIDIDESGAASYVIGAVGGPLKLDLSGSIGLSAASATALALDLSGNGSVRIAHVSGPATIGISGHGHVLLDQATITTLTAELSGAGSLDIAAGRIGPVKIDVSGVGGVVIGADVGDAQVDLSGVGSVRFKGATGQVEKEISGLGSVTVGR